MTVVVVDEELAECARVANEGHMHLQEILTRAACDGARAAISVGQTLLVAFDRCAKGDWGKWVGENLDFDRASAQNYMRLANYQGEIEQWIEHGGSGSQTGALQLLKGLPMRYKGRLTRKESDGAAAALDMRASGMSLAAIGASLGVSDQTVLRWTDPKYRKRSTQRTNEAKKRRTAAARALARETERKDRASLAASVGGATEIAYQRVRLCAEALDKAAAVCPGHDEREYLQRAVRHLHRAEEAVVEALALQRVRT